MAMLLEIKKLQDELINFNKELITKYPFLQIQDGYYDYTYLNDVPIGWRQLALGLCAELKEVLIQENALDDYAVLCVKEKWGALRWYGSYNSDAVREILTKYWKASARLCCDCGAPAVYQTTGWIRPYCKRCADLIKDENPHELFEPLNLEDYQ